MVTFLELYKKCKQKLRENIENCKDTLVSEEETLFGNLKETAILERRKKKSGRQKDEEEEHSKSKSIRKVSPLVTNLGKSSEKSAETLLVPKITTQENVKPDQPRMLDN